MSAGDRERGLAFPFNASVLPSLLDNFLPPLYYPVDFVGFVSAARASNPG
jgi:hypothetical protein